MIYSLQGILAEKESSGAVVVCNGVGYYVFCSANTLSNLPELGKEVFLYTVFSVKVNAVELDGFSTEEERDLFKLLCTVNGVGPKLAFSILSTYIPDRLILLIGSSDSTALTSCPGVGSRIAQRIVVELKDKVVGLNIGEGTSIVSTKSSSSIGEALEALVSLGFSNSEASKALSSLDTGMSSEELITNALRLLASRK